MSKTPRTISASTVDDVAQHAPFNGFERDFFKRVWSPGLEVYDRRIRAMGITGKEHVLDCGFGMGQWTVCLADLNTRVSGIEYEQSRVTAVNDLFAKAGIANAQLRQAASEHLPFGSETFDFVFSYGVLFLTDLRKSLDEVKRVLRPGGEFYFTMNDIGWFLFLIVEEHNKSAHDDPRQIGADTIAQSLAYFRGGAKTPGTQLATPKTVLRALLEERGFRDIEMTTEGGLAQARDPEIRSFYKHQTYLGHDCIYDIRCKI
jgi:ubiquinone/menaquinone biosynthesis C-methylase UbiE